MAQNLHDGAADLSIVQGRTVAVVGGDASALAHALNLRDSGVDVRLCLPEGAAGDAQAVARAQAEAEAEGLFVLPIDEAVEEADVVALLTPPQTQGDLFAAHVDPHLQPGTALVFGHGYAVRYGQVVAPADSDVVLVAPIAPGQRVRDEYVDGRGVSALVAVEQDASGEALDLALSYAKAIGGLRAGGIRTTFAEQAEADLFGGQAALAGGVAQLVRYGFETLIEAGHQPEVAYLAAVGEAQRVIDRMAQGGLAMPRGADGSWPEFPGRGAGPRIVGEGAKDTMRDVLGEIRDGSFDGLPGARAESDESEPASRRASVYLHPVDFVGTRVRRLMPWTRDGGAASR